MPRIDERMEELASGQHGLVARQQLLALGLTPRMVTVRVRGGRLRPVHRGVYRVGPVELPDAREMAAVLACGERAAVSRRSAAWLWEAMPRPDASSPVDVVVEGTSRGVRAGIRPHRVAVLDPRDVTTVRGIPVTTPARTLVDLAAVVSARELERAVARADRLGLVSPAELSSLLVRRRGRPGASALRAVLRSAGGPALTRSEAERRFLDLVRAHRLPAPSVNVRVAGCEVDFFWRPTRIAVEVDGFAFHSSRRQFEQDRRRDTRLAAAGIQVIRLTWNQIVDDSGPTMVALAQALARAEARGR